MQSTKAFVCEIFRGQSGGLSLKWGRGRGVPQILPNFLGKKNSAKGGLYLFGEKIAQSVCMYIPWPIIYFAENSISIFFLRDYF